MTTCRTQAITYTVPGIPGIRPWRYPRSVNFREGWRGHLWQERFHSFPLDERYLLATVRYVERNPVAARLCASCDEWPWSSAWAHLSATGDELVKVQPMLERVHDWQQYLSPPIDAVDEQSQRKHLRTGRPLGAAGFTEQIEKLLNRTLCEQKPGPKSERGRD